MAQYGEEISFELNSADASAGLAVPIYDPGSIAARVLRTHETLVITDVLFAAAAGGDIRFFFNRNGDQTLTAGMTIGRITAAANGGLQFNFDGTHRYGPQGIGLAIIAPAGVVDILGTGYVKQA